MNHMSREEYIQVAKENALQYLTSNPPNIMEAFHSITSDLKKHPATQNHSAISQGVILLNNMHIETATDMAQFISSIK